MTKLADLMRTVEKNSIMIGDFNMPGVDWETGHCRANERQVVEAMEDKFMVQLVDFATHVKGNILDLVVTNMPERILEVREEGRLGKSDHSILVVELSVGKGEDKREEVRYDWKGADWYKMDSLLREK
jgi:endonuclease/exonuclease/phosphatase family metal-dependent hydrolase